MPTGLGNWSPVSGEGGHVTLAASNELEAALLTRIRGRFGHASAERVLSGQGLVNLYRAICEVNGSTPIDLRPQDVTSHAIASTDSLCAQTTQVFSSFLGSVAGNLALTLGARGGLYLGGGILPQMGASFNEGAFRLQFENKGRFSEYLRHIPTWLITASTPALIGASRALDA
jgi:glucokinase